MNLGIILLISLFFLIIICIFIYYYSQIILNNFFLKVKKDIEFILKYEIAPKTWLSIFYVYIINDTLSKKILIFKLDELIKSLNNNVIVENNFEKEKKQKKLLEIKNRWKLNLFLDIYPYKS